MPAIPLPLSIHDRRFVPTIPSSGISAPPIDLKIIAETQGILIRESGSNRWGIRGMPLLCQGDSALDGPLSAMFAPFSANELPKKLDSNGKPLLDAKGKPIRFTATEIKQAMKDVGCYNTSIVTVIIAALANAAPDIKAHLKNRTKLFDEIPASQGVSKAINQLAWAYMLQLKHEISKEAATLVWPHYFHEVVADLGFESIKEACDPYHYGACPTATLKSGNGSAFRHFYTKNVNELKELTNDYIIELMKQGTVPMIAYIRHLPKILPIVNSIKNNGYTFADGNPHKVVFNGFQPGKYPLRIYDVGDGKAYNVRISCDLREMNFDLSKFGGKEHFDTNFNTRPFLIYEGKDEITSNEEKMQREILFIDHYDGLKIRNKTQAITRINSWSDWEDLGGPVASSPGVASWSKNRLDTFVKGADLHLLHKWWNGSNWSGWEDLGGQITSSPAAVSWGPNRIDVFARGFDNHMQHIWWNGSNWSGWEDLGGSISSTVGVASWSPNRLDTFARGASGNLVHKWWNGSNWSGWEDLGGALKDGPGAVSWGPNRIDVFAQGINNNLVHRWWDGNSWSGWEDLAGEIHSFVGAASWSKNRLDIFARRKNGNLLHRWWNGSNWSAWEDLGGQLKDGPAAVSWGANRLDVFAQGIDDHMWHIWWDGNS